MTPGVYTTGRGYEEIRPAGREGASAGVKHHRVLAFAWGMIDGLDDPREIDHCEHAVGWLNAEWNLEPLETGEHQRRTRQRAAERRRRRAVEGVRAMADGGRP